MRRGSDLKRLSVAIFICKMDSVFPIRDGVIEMIKIYVNVHFFPLNSANLLSLKGKSVGEKRMTQKKKHLVSK